jgi:alginate O-acetyltransferase complex protein AlgI
MVFSDPVFLFLFLPIVFGLYFLVPRSLKNYVLLIANLIFYAWDERLYALVMVASIVFNYAMGLFVDRYRGMPSMKTVIGLCIAGNLAMLVWFKYANFIVKNFDILLAAAHLPTIDLAPVHLPIGISFFTFQAMSYVIDVYRDEVKVQRNPITLALYKTLFPQLIAGPIVRYSTIAAELKSRTVDVPGFSSGVRRFIVGLTKKMVIANPAGLRADQIFGLASNDLSAPISWLGVACYTIQIYFDFSGYSDMAIGLGRMLGFHFLENFDYPYSSKSITEFWRKWHISLSTWFRDYLYIPLGGNRGSKLMTYRNQLIVFTVCGFWHGASWNFLIWGLIHGLLLVIEKLGGGNLLKRLPHWVGRVYVLFFVMISWVFFRADTLPEAFAFLGAMFGLARQVPGAQGLSFFLDPEILIVLAIGAVASMPAFPFIKKKISLALPGRAREIMSLAGTMACLFLCAVLMAGGAYNPFIYFRF